MSDVCPIFFRTVVKLFITSSLEVSDIFNERTHKNGGGSANKT